MNIKQYETCKTGELRKVLFLDGYLVSEFGKIYSVLQFKGELRELKVQNRGGKKWANLRTRRGSKAYDVATLVCKAFHHNPDRYEHVEFINGNPLDCRADNLAWVKHSTDKRSTHTLEEAESVVIMLLEATHTANDIAETLNVDAQFVRNIHERRSFISHFAEYAVQDRVGTLTRQRKERVKVTDEVISAIQYDLFRGVLSQTRIAEKHGVSQPVVTKVKKGRIKPSIAL